MIIEGDTIRRLNPSLVSMGAGNLRGFEDETDRSGVATAYSFAGAASLITLASWITVSVANGRWIRVAVPGFFDAAVQVLPVLLLTFAIERVFFERTTSQLATRATSIVAFIVVLGLTAVGELLSMLALVWTGGAPDALRVLGGLTVLLATAGSLALIVGFAAVRSGVVLDMRAGLRVVIEGPPDDFDPRASIAAQAAAMLLALGATALAVLSLGGGLIIGVWQSQGDAGLELVTIIGGVCGFVLFGVPSGIHLRRVVLRTRRRRMWHERRPDFAQRFEQLTAEDVNALPQAARRVIVGTYTRLVDTDRDLSEWPSVFANAELDARLTLSERAALRALKGRVSDAVAAVVRERREADQAHPENV